MAKQDRVILFASIDRVQHEALRYIAYKEKRSIADVTREAIKGYLEAKGRTGASQ